MRKIVVSACVSWVLVQLLNLKLACWSWHAATIAYPYGITAHSVGNSSRSFLASTNRHVVVVSQSRNAGRYAYYGPRSHAISIAIHLGEVKVKISPNHCLSSDSDTCSHCAWQKSKSWSPAKPKTNTARMGELWMNNSQWKYSCQARLPA